MISETSRILANPNNLLLGRDEIQKRVKELADQLSHDYAESLPVLICVLNGGFLFFADLVRELTIDCEVDFVKISSYGNSMKSSGKVRILKNIDCHIEGRDVVVVEDIIDSGLSVQFLRRWLMEMKPNSLRMVSLLVKEDTAVVDYQCEYIGFRIPNKFVIGYGLDVAQKFRNLPAVYVMQNTSEG